MSKDSMLKLAEVKLELARKYENLARISGGKKKCERHLRRAKSFRHQAEELSREAKANA
jgi:hypothetical protein